MKKVAIIISQLNKSLAFEWLAEGIDKENFKLVFILLNPGDSALGQFLEGKDILFYRVRFRGKSDLLTAIFRIYRILKKEKIQVVHTHLVNAGIAGLTAACMSGIKNRIITLHHGVQHRYEHKKGLWLDRYLFLLCTKLIVPSEIVFNRLLIGDKALSSKMQVLHHGFDWSRFEHVGEQQIREIREKYGLNNVFPVIGVLSRYVEWKGVQYIIRAFEGLIEQFPEAVLLLAGGGDGYYSHHIRNKLAKLPRKNIREIHFEPDIAALYKVFDVFVHVPVYADIEAFGQTYMEALITGVPSVFTLSGIAHEIIKDKENALVVPYADEEAIQKAIALLIKDSDFRQKFSQTDHKGLENEFGIKGMIARLEEIYAA